MNKAVLTVTAFGALLLSVPASGDPRVPARHIAPTPVSLGGPLALTPFSPAPGAPARLASCAGDTVSGGSGQENCARLSVVGSRPALIDWQRKLDAVPASVPSTKTGATWRINLDAGPGPLGVTPYVAILMRWD